MLVEILLFYVLNSVSAPAWCYVLNLSAIFVSIFKTGLVIARFIHKYNPMEES